MQREHMSIEGQTACQQAMMHPENHTEIRLAEFAYFGIGFSKAWNLQEAKIKQLQAEVAALRKERVQAILAPARAQLITVIRQAQCVLGSFAGGWGARGITVLLDGSLRFHQEARQEYLPGACLEDLQFADLSALAQVAATELGRNPEDPEHEQAAHVQKVTQAALQAGRATVASRLFNSVESPEPAPYEICSGSGWYDEHTNHWSQFVMLSHPGFTDCIEGRVEVVFDAGAVALEAWLVRTDTAEVIGRYK